MNLVAPFGFFGAGNIGDEATLQGFARLIESQGNGFHVWVASRCPSHTAQVEPAFKYYSARGRDLRRKWARFRSAGHVMVGGTPIMDVLGAWPLSELTPLVEAAYDRQKPIVFLGVGTESLHRDKSKRVILETIAPKVKHWSVRSPHDKERLISYGVSADRVTVAADLAWMLEPVSDRFGRELLHSIGLDDGSRFVGVNLNSERFVVEQEPRLFEKMGCLMDELVKEHGVRILFLCNEVREGETYDRVASQKVLHCMKYRDNAVMIENKYWSPQQMLSLIACCHATIGIRYHFCLFSALEGVPFIALQRSDKVADLCWDMKWPYGVDLADLSVIELLRMFSEISENREASVELLRNSAASMRQRTLKNNVALAALADRSE